MTAANADAGTFSTTGNFDFGIVAVGQQRTEQFSLTLGGEGPGSPGSLWADKFCTIQPSVCFFTGKLTIDTSHVDTRFTDGIPQPEWVMSQQPTYVGANTFVFSVTFAPQQYDDYSSYKSFSIGTFSQWEYGYNGPNGFVHDGGGDSRDYAGFSLTGLSAPAVTAVPLPEALPLFALCLSVSFLLSGVKKGLHPKQSAPA